MLGLLMFLALCAGLVCLGIGLAELLYYRLTRPKAAPPNVREEDKAPDTGRE